MDDDVLALIRPRTGLEMEVKAFEGSTLDTSHGVEYYNPKGDISPEARRPYYELRFDSFRHGLFTIGRSNDCQLIFNHEGISQFHLALTFDQKNRLVLRDIRGEHLSEVSYGNHQFVHRSQFSYILNGFRHLHHEIVRVNLPGNVGFEMILLFRDVTSQSYMTSINEFRQDGLPLADQLTHRLKELTGCYGGTVPGEDHPMHDYGGDGNTSCYLEYGIGKGGFGAVALLWNVQTGECYACKRPKVQLVTLKEAQMWEREAGMMRSFHHPHIIKPAVGSFGRDIKIVMEYAPLGSLEIAHQAQPLTPQEVREVLQQILLALSYLHGPHMSLSHRDLTPANIFVFKRENGRIFVKIGDFGLSRRLNEPMARAGTFAYTAPEIHHETPNPGVFSRAADLWAAGVIAYEALHGLPSSEGLSMSPQDCMKWCQRIVDKFQGDLNNNPGDPLMRLIKKLLVMNQDKRPTATKCYVMALMV